MTVVKVMSGSRQLTCCTYVQHFSRDKSITEKDVIIYLFLYQSSITFTAKQAKLGQRNRNTIFLLTHYRIEPSFAHKSSCRVLSHHSVTSNVNRENPEGAAL